MADLQSTRVRASASYGWRSKAGRAISEAEYQAMPEDTDDQKKAKAKFSWRPDPKAVGELVEAKRAETARVAGERMVPV